MVQIHLSYIMTPETLEKTHTLTMKLLEDEGSSAKKLDHWMSAFLNHTTTPPFEIKEDMQNISVVSNSPSLPPRERNYQHPVVPIVLQ